jgi:hypothetical protein
VNPLRTSLTKPHLCLRQDQSITIKSLPAPTQHESSVLLHHHTNTFSALLVTINRPLHSLFLVHTFNPKDLSICKSVSPQDDTPVSCNCPVPIQDGTERHTFTGATTDRLYSNAVAFGSTAQIIAGSGADAKSFHVHRKLLCGSSTYFNAALNNGFLETKNQIIELDDEEPAIILTFVLWLYEGKLNKDTMPPDETGGELEKYLFNLYVFADKRGIKNLANDTITMLAAHRTEVRVTLSEVVGVVRLISPKSELYDLLLDILTIDLRDDEMDAPETRRLDVLSLPEAFLLDLLLKGYKLSQGFQDYDQCFRAVCHYHCHEGEGVMSEEDCVRNIEEGWNIYHELDALTQVCWEGFM